LKTERRRVFEFVDGVMCDDVSENESVLFVLYKGEKKESEALGFKVSSWWCICNLVGASSHVYRISIQN